MHDGVSLEARKVPTAVIVTTEFHHAATVQCAALGMAEPEPVVIRHPLSTLTDAQIAERIADAVGRAKETWRGG